MKKAVISVKLRTDANVSVEQCVVASKARAANRKLNVIDIYCDQVKNNRIRKRAFETLLKDCKSHKFECVIIKSLANLTHNTKELNRHLNVFKETDIKLISLSDEDNKLLETKELTI